MPYRLDFSQRYTYTSTRGNITVPVVLRCGDRMIDVTAAVDTGAAYCLFESGLASQLGLELTEGIPMRFRTANSTFEAFGHEVEIQVLGVRNQAIVYFFAEPAITRNVLGRTGWLDRVRLGLVDYDQQLYLSGYDDEPTA